MAIAIAQITANRKNDLEWIGLMSSKSSCFGGAKFGYDTLVLCQSRIQMISPRSPQFPGAGTAPESGSGVSATPMSCAKYRDPAQNSAPATSASRQGTIIV